MAAASRRSPEKVMGVPTEFVTQPPAFGAIRITLTLEPRAPTIRIGYFHAHTLHDPWSPK